jgi:hypothetical protein
MMQHRSAWTRLLIAGQCFCLLATTGGCGFLRTKGPPIGHENQSYFSCTESNSGSIVDFVLAGLSGLGMASALSDEYYAGRSDAWAITSGAIWVALYTTSGIVGRKKVARCRDARRLLADRLAAQKPAQEPTQEPADPIPFSVRVDPSQNNIAIGDQVQLSATALNSSHVGVPGRSFAWISSDDAVASVSSAGLVTAKAEGRVIIAANTGGVVGTAEVVVGRSSGLLRSGG